MPWFDVSFLVTLLLRAYPNHLESIQMEPLSLRIDLVGTL